MGMRKKLCASCSAHRQYDASVAFRTSIPRMEREIINLFQSVFEWQYFFGSRDGFVNTSSPVHRGKISGERKRVRRRISFYTVKTKRILDISLSTINEAWLTFNHPRSRVMYVYSSPNDVTSLHEGSFRLFQHFYGGILAQWFAVYLFIVRTEDTIVQRYVEIFVTRVYSLAVTSVCTFARRIWNNF